MVTSYSGLGNTDSRFVAATRLLTPNSDCPKHVAGLTSTRCDTSSGAAAATRSARHPPNDSPTRVTCESWVVYESCHKGTREGRLVPFSRFLFASKEGETSYLAKFTQH